MEWETFVFGFVFVVALLILAYCSRQSTPTATTRLVVIAFTLVIGAYAFLSATPYAVISMVVGVCFLAAGLFLRHKVGEEWECPIRAA